MKRSTFIFIIACIATLSIVGCKNTNKKTQQENTTEISLASKALDVNGLLNVAEEQLNDTVVLKGVVKHTCSHSVLSRTPRVNLQSVLKLAVTYNLSTKSWLTPKSS